MRVLAGRGSAGRETDQGAWPRPAAYSVVRGACGRCRLAHALLQPEAGSRQSQVSQGLWRLCGQAWGAGWKVARRNPGHPAGTLLVCGLSSLFNETAT